MILLLMAGGIVLFLLFSRKGKETLTTINRIFENPVNNTATTVSGENVDFSEDEYHEVGHPDDPVYNGYIYVHTPTNVRVKNIGTHIPMGWQYAYYPHFQGGGGGEGDPPSWLVK